MTDPLMQFVDDLSTDPRQYITRRLLEVIAGVWRDEERIQSISLDFTAIPELQRDEDDNGSVMTCFVRPRQSRADFDEFASLFLQPGPPEPEYTTAERVQFAQWRVEAAQEALSAAQRKHIRAQGGLKAAIAAAEKSLAESDDDLGDA
jgi:hypothetical protein